MTIYNLMKMQLLRRIPTKMAVLKIFGWSKQNISSTTIVLKPWKSFVFHHEGEKQRPWLNYSPPTQFRLICMQAVQLKYGFQPIPFRQKSQITDKSLSRMAASYFSGTEYLPIKIPPRRLVQKNSQPGMPGLEDGRVSLHAIYVMKQMQLKFGEGEGARIITLVPQVAHLDG